MVCLKVSCGRGGSYVVFGRKLDGGRACILCTVEQSFRVLLSGKRFHKKPYASPSNRAVTTKLFGCMDPLDWVPCFLRCRHIKSVAEGQFDHQNSVPHFCAQLGDTAFKENRHCTSHRTLISRFPSFPSQNRILNHVASKEEKV